MTSVSPANAGVVQRFHVGHANRKLEPFQIDALVHDRVEHEAVVGAGKSRARASCVIQKASAVASRLTIASSIFHASRLRRLDEVRHGPDLRERHLVDQARGHERRPSMLSTCGLQRSTIAAMERSLPCTVFTVIPVTVGS